MDNNFPSKKLAFWLNFHFGEALSVPRTLWDVNNVNIVEGKVLFAEAEPAHGIAESTTE